MLQTPWDAPKTLRQSGSAPADMDDGLRELVRRYDDEAAQGRHPSTLTIQWNDASLSMEGSQWQAFKAGKRDLMDLGGSLDVKPGAMPVPPKSTTNPIAATAVGCGALAVLALLLMIALFFMRRRSRKSKAAQISAPPQRPTDLVLLTGDRAGQRIPLGTTMRIGRDADNELILAAPSVSRHHATIQWDGQRFVLWDLGSANGTFVEGQRLSAPVPLQAGMNIGFGEIRAQLN